MDRVISWNNCQFRQPDDLWRFVLQLEPLMKRMPAKYYVNIDLLHKAPLDSPDRTDFYNTWQKPADFSIESKINHIVYSDAKGQGYAALTLRATSSQNNENRQGDHGFYLGMTAIYFYFNSLTKPKTVSTHEPPQTLPRQSVISEPNWSNDDDLDNFIPTGIENAYQDIESYLDEDVNYLTSRNLDDGSIYDQKSKVRRSKAMKRDNTLDDIEDELP